MKGRTMGRFQGLPSSTVGHGLPRARAGTAGFVLSGQAQLGAHLSGDTAIPLIPGSLLWGRIRSGGVSPLLGATLVGQCRMGSSH